MSDIAYKGFRRDELEYQYNPLLSVPGFAERAKVRSAQARQVRENAKPWLDVAYGSSPREKVDIYPADQPGGPVLVYIHGGFWRSGSTDDYCNFVPTFTKRGATVVMVGYDLCPQVTISDIVRQTRASIAWIHQHIARYGGDASRLFISGHSAGGHLAAMVLAHDWEKEGLPLDSIKGAVSISGVHDLDMVMQISVQEDARLTPAAAKENSPFLHPIRTHCPVVVAVGGAEPPGWQQMSEDYFEFCTRSNVSAEYLVVAGADHFGMTEALLDDTNPLVQAMVTLLGV